MSKTSTEEQEYKEFDWNITKRLLIFIKPYKKVFLLSFLLMLLTTVLGPLRPVLSKIAIDNYVLHSNKTGFLLFVLLIFILLFLHSTIQFLANYLMKWLGQSAILGLRTKVFEHLQKLDISFFDRNPVGRLVTRVTNDIETISELLSGGIILIITDLVLIVAIIGFMFYLNFSLTLITLSILPLLVFATWIFRNKVRKTFREIRKSVAKLNTFINEFLSGILTIKLFNREKEFNAKFETINSENKNLWVKTINYYAIFFPTIEFLSAVSLGLIIWYTSENILSGFMTIGTFFAFIQYAEMFYRPIRDLSEKFTNLQNAMASSERIFEILDTKITNIVSPIKKTFEKLDKSIEFENVWFSYDGEKQVLIDVSFKINKGETVALVGHTGAGKTTIVNLLCRFYDVSSGKILIDGEDIRSYDLSSLRSKISYVSQDVFLFSRRIIENLTLGDGTIDFEEIVNATKEIGSFDFINKLPERFNTNVVEKGITLSSGQKQLLSFTRAIIRNPEILILDEATSNIDPELEKQIENAILKLISGRTSIVIAHRFSTIQRADKIIVLHKGRVREIGTHSELIRMDGIYSKLFKLQFENHINSIKVNK
ncbi:MAG: ABC transporter ATP-binding protein/permease [Ignavibacteria bacterium]|nr:ABC transporter ATP-binding protein/permease [Ignavibacteria bacterium]